MHSFYMDFCELKMFFHNTFLKYVSKIDVTYLSNYLVGKSGQKLQKDRG